MTNKYKGYTTTPPDKKTNDSRTETPDYQVAQSGQPANEPEWQKPIREGLNERAGINEIVRDKIWELQKEATKKERDDLVTRNLAEPKFGPISNSKVDLDEARMKIKMLVDEGVLKDRSKIDQLLADPTVSVRVKGGSLTLMGKADGGTTAVQITSSPAFASNLTVFQKSASDVQGFAAVSSVNTDVKGGFIANERDADGSGHSSKAGRINDYADKMQDIEDKAASGAKSVAPRLPNRSLSPGR